MIVSYCENNRFYVYLALFGIWQLYELFKHYLSSKAEQLEMQILENSFAIEEGMQGLASIAASIDPDDKEENVEISFDPKSEEKLRLALDQYIRERQSIYAEHLDAKILAEQEKDEKTNQK